MNTLDPMQISMWREQLELAGPSFRAMVDGDEPWEPLLTLAATSSASILAALGSGAGRPAPPHAATEDGLPEEVEEAAGEVVALALGPGRALLERAVEAVDLTEMRFIPAPDPFDEPADTLMSTVELASLAALVRPTLARRIGAHLDQMLAELGEQLLAMAPPEDAPDELPPRAEDDTSPLSDLERALHAEQEVLDRLDEVRALSASLGLPRHHPAAAYLRAVAATLEVHPFFSEAPLAEQFEQVAELAWAELPAHPFESVREELEAIRAGLEPERPAWVRVRDWLRGAKEDLARWVDSQVETLESPLPATASSGDEVGLTPREVLGRVRGGELSLVARAGGELLLEWISPGADEAPRSIYIPTRGDRDAGEAVPMEPVSGPLSRHGASYWALRVPHGAASPPTLVLRFSDGDERLEP